MYWKWTSFLALAVLITALAAVAQPAGQANLLHEFKRRAAKFNCVITVPQFEMTTNGVGAAVRNTIAVGNAALDRVGALKPGKVTFENTVRALDDIGYEISLTDDRLQVMKETSTSAAMRDTATEALKQLEEWQVGLDYREDVYKAIKAYADTKPKLTGEDARLLEETMRDFRRAGIGSAQGAAR